MKRPPPRPQDHRWPFLQAPSQGLIEIPRSIAGGQNKQMPGKRSTVLDSCGWFRESFLECSFLGYFCFSWDCFLRCVCVSGFLGGFLDECLKCFWFFEGFSEFVLDCPSAFFFTRRKTIEVKQNWVGDVLRGICFGSGLGC